MLCGSWGRRSCVVGIRCPDLGLYWEALGAGCWVAIPQPCPGRRSQRATTQVQRPHAGTAVSVIVNVFRIIYRLFLRTLNDKNSISHISHVSHIIIYIIYFKLFWFYKAASYPGTYFCSQTGPSAQRENRSASARRRVCFSRARDFGITIRLEWCTPSSGVVAVYHFGCLFHN